MSELSSISVIDDAVGPNLILCHFTTILGTVKLRE